jgi:hypothetical protein
MTAAQRHHHRHTPYAINPTIAPRLTDSSIQISYRHSQGLDSLRSRPTASIQDINLYFDSTPPNEDKPNPFKVEAESKLTLALHSSFAPQTDRNYGYAIKHFIQFAISCGIPEHKALPCDPHILLLWLADGIGKTGDSIAQGNLSALAAWHKINNAPFEIPTHISKSS